MMLKIRLFIAALAVCLAFCCGTVVVWGGDALLPNTTQKPELVLQLAHSQDVTATAFAADGQHLITASDDDTLKWWNVQTSELLRTVTPHQGRILALRAAPNGEIVASGGKVGGVKLWNARAGTWVRTLLDESDGVSALAFSADGSTLAAVSAGIETSEVVIWDARNWQVQRRFQIANSTSALALSADGSLVAVGGVKPKLTGVWETRANKLRFLFDEQLLGKLSYGINALAFVPPRAGETVPLLATVSYQWKQTQHSQIHLWNAQTGEHLRVLLATDTIATEIAFSPNGDALALRQQMGGSGDSNAQLWAMPGESREQCTLKSTLSLPDVRLKGFSFAPDGQSLACGSSQVYPWKQKAYVFDARNGQLTREIAGNRNRNPVSAVFLSRERLTMIGSSSQQWDARTGATLGVLKQQDRTALSPDGALLAEISNDEVHIEDANSRQILHWLRGEAGDQAEFLLFSPDSRLLLTRQHETVNHVYRHLLKLWDARTGRLLQKFDSNGYGGRRSDSVAFSPDSATLAVGGGALVQLWEVKTGQLRAELHSLVNGRREGPIVFSRDGRYLAAAVRVARDDTASSVIKVWDVATEKIIQQLPDADERAVSVTFSADGAVLAVGEKYGAVLLWDVATGKLRQKLEGHASAVNSVAFAEDANDTRLVSGGEDGRTKIWDVTHGKLLATFQILRHQWSNDEPQRVLHDWIVYTPDGYYRASAEAAPFIRWRLGDELLPATETDPFNRPDLVQQALQNQ